MRIDAAIIGGTGVGELLDQLPGSPLFVPTRFGQVKGRLIRYKGAEVFSVQRHSKGHSLPPHRVNYLGIASAVKSLGARGCLSTAAVGSLNAEWPVGQLVICKDFLDLTGRNLTVFGESVVHRDFTHPFDSDLGQLLLDTGAEMGLPMQDGGIYVNTNGPRFETAREIETLRILGGNLVGMTAASEAVAMREVLVPYACVAIVTNAAAGMGEGELSHLDVGKAMRERGSELLTLLLDVAEKWATR